MEILFIAPFALLLGIIEEAREMTEEQFPDDIVPSRIRHVPKYDQCESFRLRWNQIGSERESRRISRDG